MRVYFEEILCKVVKRWMDKDGRRRQKTRTFSQTVSPCGRNADELIKRRKQIWDEICKELDGRLRKK
jgi:hypothetical protein